MSRNRSHTQDEGGYSWMDTYGDMVTLLLSFFVLLFAFSTVNQAKWNKLVAVITGNPPLTRITAVDMLSMPNFGEYVPQGYPDIVEMNLQGGKGVGTGEGSSDGKGGTASVQTGYSGERLQVAMSAQQRELMNSREYQEIEAQFSRLFDDLALYIENNGLQDMLFASRDMESIYLRVSAGVFFESGKADLLPEAESVLNTIEEIFYTAGDSLSLIVVEGHTDNVPIHTVRFRDNWELSSMRAINVVRYIMDQGRIEPEMFSFSGYGEHKPIAANDTEEGRQMNRRVEFVLRKRIITTLDLSTAEETDLVEEKVSEEALPERLEQEDQPPVYGQAEGETQDTAPAPQ